MPLRNDALPSLLLSMVLLREAPLTERSFQKKKGRT